MTVEHKTDDSLARLFERRTFGVKLGLDVERRLLDELGSPQQAYGVVHVAGTNGKGSVCALVDSILRAAGYRTGLYTSPHLRSFHERIMVAGMPIGDPELACVIDKVEAASERVAEATGCPPTFFECATAMALDHFRDTNVQVAILETGLGGRLDATNVVTPLVSVITRIALDHAAHLGTDLEAIAVEKCGIIKRGRPVVCGGMPEEALALVKKRAAEVGAPLVCVEEVCTLVPSAIDLSGQKVRVDTRRETYGTARFPLLGVHQLENLATAVVAAEMLCDIVGTELTPEALREGVESVSWPGRFQVLSNDPPLIADGAHNANAALALAATLRSTLKGRPLALIWGMCGDKDALGFLKPLAPLVRRGWGIPIRSARSMSSSVLVAEAKGCDVQLEEATLAEAMLLALDWARREGGAVCVTGSLFLVGEVLELLESEHE